MLIAIRLDPEVLARFRKEAKRRQLHKPGDPPGVAAADGAQYRGGRFAESLLAILAWRRYHRTMKSKRQLTAIIERDDDVYVALCPGGAGHRSQARRSRPQDQPIEALELFFESSGAQREIARRLHSEVFVTRVEVAVG